MTQRNSVASTTSEILSISDDSSKNLRLFDEKQESIVDDDLDEVDEYDDETHPDMKLPPGTKYS